MGKSLSKRKRNSNRFPVARDSWVIRFSAVSDVVVVPDHNNHFHGYNLAYYYWNCPDCIPAQHFSKLIIMILQIHQQGDFKTISNLIKRPLSALDLIDQCNKFLESSHQDMSDLEKELLDNANDNFFLYIDNKQLCYLDLLINNHFDCHNELRNILCACSGCGSGEAGIKQQKTHDPTDPVVPPPMPVPLEPTAPYEPVGASVDNRCDNMFNTQEHQLPPRKTVASLPAYSQVPVTSLRKPDIQATTTITTESVSIATENHSNRTMQDNQDPIKRQQVPGNTPMNGSNGMASNEGQAATASELLNQIQSLDNNEPCVQNSTCVNNEQKSQALQSDTQLESTNTHKTANSTVSSPGETSNHTRHLKHISFSNNRDTQLESTNTHDTANSTVSSLGRTSNHTRHLQYIGLSRNNPEENSNNCQDLSRNEPVDNTNNRQNSCRKNDKYTYAVDNSFIPIHGLSHSIYKRLRTDQDVNQAPERKRYKPMEEQPSTSRSDGDDSTNE